MAFCEEHAKLDEKLDDLLSTVNRIDHGLNGINGSIGLVTRVERIENVIRSNKSLWSTWRGITGHGAILLRMIAWSVLCIAGSGLLTYVLSLR